jgi:hypothetical protein
MLRDIYNPLLIIIGRIVRPVVYAAISVAIVAYIYTSYPLQHIADIPLAQLTLRKLVNNVGFVLAMLFGITLGGGIIRAGFTDDDVDHDHGWLLVVLTLVFLFQRSDEYMTLGGYALRAIGAIVAWLTTEFVGRAFTPLF